MAIEYDFELSTRVSRTQALELLVSRIEGLTWAGDRFFLLGPTIEIDVSTPSESRREAIRDGFQFAPTLSVVFRFKANTDYELSQQIMFQAAMLLLEEAQDAVLLFNYELIVLQRLGGRLVFNSQFRLWEDDDWLRSRGATAFERRPLPSPLL